MPSFSLHNVGDQKQALVELANLTQRSILTPEVLRVARQVTNDCPSREDECELQAIYDAVKKGHPRVKALRKGLRYVSDPVLADWFTGPRRMLEMCSDGACGADCDEHAALVAALAAAVGFEVGLRAWGPTSRKDYVHVYAVAGLPKKSPQKFVGMDTTVEQADVGWEPPRGRVLTAYLQRT